MTCDRGAASDHELAEHLALGAGALLVELRERLGAQGASGARLKAEGDQRSQELLAAGLARWRPGDAVLSEEAADDRSRLSSRRVWVVDPLDGTREFSEPPRTDWAVHVALAVDGRPVVGAVALPAQGVVLSTLNPPHSPPPNPAVTGAGPSANTPPVPTGGPSVAQPPGDGRVRIAVSRTRPPVEAEFVAATLGGQLVPMGSAGAKSMAVVQGEVDAYLHSGGQYEWDSCAPAAVALAAGCVAVRLDGSELRYNQPDPWMPDLVVCRPELYPTLRTALDSRGGA